MIILLILFTLGTYRSVGAEVMIGLTSAMAFSALETAGYGFKAFLGTLERSGSSTVGALFRDPLNIFMLDVNVAFRSMLDPLGHGTWTMLICFVLFDEARKAGRAVLSGRVILAFVLACMLHSSWDTTLSIPSDEVWARILGYAGFLVTAVFTIRLMRRIIRKTREVMEG